MAGSKACLANSWALEGGTDGRTDKRTVGRTDGRNISPFYRTLSPIGAAALKSEVFQTGQSELGRGKRKCYGLP